MRRTTRTTVFVVSVAIGLAMLAGPAGAGGPNHEDPFPIDPHPHVLLLNAEFADFFTPTSAEGCVDLAANQALTLNAHHRHVHFGQPGFVLRTKGAVTHAIIPTKWFPTEEDPLPWSDCQSLSDFFGLGL